MLPVAAAVPLLASSGAETSASDLRTAGLAAIGVAMAAGLAIGALAVLDRRGRAPFGGREGRVAAGALAVLVLGLVALVARVGEPVSWSGDRWDEFTTLAPSGGSADASRFGTGTSNRYDYWRVAAGVVADHPVGGVGAGAFAVPWFRERSLDENVTDAHSWVAGALAETGVVGLALLGGALALALAGAWRAGSGPGAWPIAAAGLGGSAAFYVAHAGVDWLGRIPAVSIPAFVALGALATGGEAAGLALAGARTRAVGAAVAVAGAVLVLPLYVANRAVVRAEERAVTSTAAAVDELDRAARLDPLAVEPRIVESTLLLVDGDVAGALEAAEDAVERGSRDWTAWVVLAEARLAAGDETAARAAVDRVAELNPRAPQRRLLRARI